MLFDYTPSNTNGVIEIVVKAEAISSEEAETALRESQYGPYTKVSALGFNKNPNRWIQPSERP